LIGESGRAWTRSGAPAPQSRYPGEVTLFSLPALIELFLGLAMICASGFGFLDAMRQRPDAFTAGDKLTKKAWLVILGLALVAHLLFWARPINIFSLAGIVAALVYLVDVRPTLLSLTRR
jgi:hypothetical protein